jgi:hypothetical protein
MMTSKLQATELALASISPKLGAKFSPNLFLFLRHRRNASILRFGRVYRDQEGSLWLGYPDDEFFIGARLVSVLCGGGRTATGAHVRLVNRLVEVEGFWNDYRRDGRCAVDPGHDMYFIGSDTRWSQRGDERTCQWCKKVTQRMRQYTEIEVTEREEWVTA